MDKLIVRQLQIAKKGMIELLIRPNWDGNYDIKYYRKCLMKYLCNCAVY